MDDPTPATGPGSLLKGALMGIAVVLGLLAVWFLVTGALALRAAMAVQNESRELQTAIRVGDAAEVQRLLPELQSDAGTVNWILNAPPWQQAGDLPYIGPSIRLTAAIAAGTDGVAQSVTGYEQQIAETASAVRADGLRASADLAELAPVSSAAALAIADPVAVAEAIQPADLAGPLRGFLTERKDQFLAAATAVAAADAAAHIAPTLLGFDGPRRWMVVFQNAAEPRGTGGLISAYSIVAVDRGRLKTIAAQTTNTIDAEAVPLRGIPADTRRLWGADLAYSYGWNLDRHFPYAGLLALRSRGAAGAEEVISLDAEAVATMLAFTGPVSAAGVEINTDNAVAFFTRDVYREFPDPRRKDAVTLALVRKTMDALFSENLDLGGLAEAIAEPAEQGHFLVYSSQPDMQEHLTGVGITGEVPDAAGPWASVAVNDNAGDKMGPYLGVDVTWRSAAHCADSGGESELAVTVTNSAPADLPPYVTTWARRQGLPTGSTQMGVAVYAPTGSAFRGADVDGDEVGVHGGTDRGHPVWMTGVDIGRGESRTFRVRFEEPRAGDQPLQFSEQPMVNPMVLTLERVAC